MSSQSNAPARPFSLKGLDHIVLRTPDPAALIGFYVDVLGAIVEREIAQFQLTQLRAGQSLIDVIGVEAPLAAAHERNVDHFCLRIDPWDETAMATYLRSCGLLVEESGIRYGAEGNGPSIYIKDPEGNVVELKGPPTE
ncbi:MAG: VOC family protein [Parvibaculaceae bacterium]|nr:VOC family protein [Parvibaculaceae bacterium]|tara:strand:- start:861 stop:1277 length:417 start_codon:yes stop_codon:yes gene_type:complete